MIVLKTPFNLIGTVGTLSAFLIIVAGKIGWAKCYRFNYSYFNGAGEAVNGTSRIVYMNRNYFSYAKTLRSNELNRLFKMKVYVEKDDKNKYMSEVYKISH